MDILNKNSADQMILGNCDSCEGLVRIPINANPNSTVKCPRCGELFTLGVLLDELAPALEIIDPPKKRSWFASKEAPATPIVDLNSTQPADRKPGEKFKVSPILSKGAKRKKRRRRSANTKTPVSSPRASNPNVGPNNGEVDIATDVEPSVMIAERIAEARKEATEAATIPETVRRRQTELPRSNSSRSGGLEMTKIILGAVLAIPVAQLLVWWFAGTDPLELGPAIGKAAPFIVPAEFREDEESDLDKIFDQDFTSGKSESSE